METVHVFLAGDGVNHLLFVDVPGQRQLHQDAVHQRVAVQRLDLCQEGFLADIGRQFHQPGLHARVGRGLHFVAHIHLAGRVLPYDNDHQAGLAAILGLQLGHLGLHFVFNDLT